MPEVVDSIEIAAPPDAVFAVITQLDQMGRFSPENTGGAWTRGSTGPALGAKFKGTNSSGHQHWSTVATVVEFAAPNAFAFEVNFGPVKIARWTYRIEPTATGSLVTESTIDRRATWVKRTLRTPVTDRDGFNRESIHTTLERLKKFLES